MSFRDRAVNRLYTIVTTPSRWRTMVVPIIMTLFLPFFVSLILLGQRIDSWLGWPHLFTPAVRLLLSMPLLFIGLFLMLWSAFYFLKARGTPVPLYPPPKLVSTGPYAHSRNPMMSGFLLTIWGSGFLLGSCTVLFFLAPLITLLALWEIKAIEEPELEKRLGDEYRSYQKRTPRLFPQLRTRRNGT